MAFLDYREPKESEDFQVQLEHLANKVKKAVMVIQDSQANRD